MRKGMLRNNYCAVIAGDKGYIEVFFDEEERIMFCFKCGNKVGEGARFCGNCGVRMPESEAVEQGADKVSMLDSKPESISMEGQKKASVFNDESAGEAEDKFNVTLTNIRESKVRIIKLVREWTGISIEESRQLVDTIPTLLKKNVTLKEAEAIKIAFMKDGADVAFTDKEGQNVEITVHCPACGTVLREGSNVCGSCGNFFDITSPYERDKVQNDSTLFCDDVDLKGEFNDVKENVMRKLCDKFKAMSVSGQVIIGMALAAAAGLVILLLVAIIRLVFSSFISIIVTAAGGYAIYHRWVAKWITEFSYGMKSKKLQLPEGMSSQTLLEALGGKFNYPYFKGVRYGEKGECVIEGKYSTYPVIFNEEGMAGLTYNPGNNEKKTRAIMLEAIAIRNYINKFFNPTLPIDVVKDLKKMNLAERQRKAVSLVLGIASFLVTVMIVLQGAIPGGLHNLLTPGAEVRNAYLSQYSNKVTIEEAFEEFFDKCKWEVNNSGDYSKVIFTGVCRYDGERSDVRIVFKLTGEKFIVDSFDVNGTTQSDFSLHILLLKVYEKY